MSSALELSKAITHISMAQYVALSTAIVVLVLLQVLYKRNKVDESQLLLKQFLASVKRVDNFALENEKPAAHRPFNPPKQSGNLKMGLTRIEQDQWLLIDRDLKKTLLEKQKALSKHPFDLIICNDVATDAIHECYDVMGRFLCQRYPQYYQLIDGNIVNKVIKSKMPFPAATSGLSGRELLDVIGRNVEEDFLLLEYNAEIEEYVLRAGNFIYPAGFNPQKLFNCGLSKIHEPVPHYREKLQSPMNRFFNKIKTGSYVQRLNWSLQQGNLLSIPSGEMGQSIGRKAGVDPETVQFIPIDPGNMNVRVERQTLSRLPQSNYLVFTIRTYLYPIKDIKSEGLGASLAESIDNLDFHMGEYKGRNYWGDAITQFLRS